MNEGRKGPLLHDSPCTPLGQSRCLSSFLSIFHILYFDIVIRIHVSVIHLETVDRKATLMIARAICSLSPPVLT